MRAQLIPEPDGEPINLEQPILLVGRSPSCDIQVSSRKISRLHCCLCLLDNSLFVRDLDSTNGVRVRGEKVSSGEIGPGDELVIGDKVFRVVLQSGTELPDDESGLSDEDKSEMMYEVSSDGDAQSHGGESVIEVDEEDLLPLESGDSPEPGRQDSIEEDQIDLLADEDPFDLGKGPQKQRGSSELPIPP